MKRTLGLVTDGCNKTDIAPKLPKYLKFNYLFKTNAFFQAIDKFGQPILWSLFGNSLFLLAFMFIGPIPMIKIEPTVTLIQVQFMFS